MNALNKSLTRASKFDPCPHCGQANDWCYRIGDLTACKKGVLPADGWIQTSKTDSEGTAYYAPERTHKAVRAKQETHFVYQDRSGNPLVRVCRVDDGNGGRKFFQQHWNGSNWEKGLGGTPRANIPIYRYREIREAIGRGETIFVVEGEGVADALWDLSIPATCNIGGSKKWQDSDSADLKGASIAICPDRDKPGIEHADRIARDFPDARWLYAYPQSHYWEKLPPNNGVDIKDWVLDYKLSREQILEAIEPRRTSTTASAPVTENKVVPFPKTRMTADDVTAELRKWLDEGVSGSALRSRLNELSSSSGWHVLELEKLFKALESEAELEDDREELKTQIDRLLAARSASIDLAEILPEALATPLTRLSQWQNLRPECYLIALLTGCSSLHANGTELILHEGMEFSVTPNIFGAIVAESSQKKSPIVKTILGKPFAALNKQARERYEAEMEVWKEECKAAEKNKDSGGEKPSEPQRKIYSFTKTTGEAILRQASRQPDQGLLWNTDELPALFKSANQYRGGKGSDLEDMLSYYDGSGGVVLRAEGVKDDVDTLNLGIFGGIQPGVLKKFLSADECQDNNGNWARFFFIQQPTAPSTMPDESGNIGVGGLLGCLYETIDRLPRTTYRLSREAFKFFQAAYNKLEKHRCNEPKQALRAAWGKTAGRIGKLALNLHVIDAVFAGVSPAPEISLQTMKKAAKLARLAIDQIEALYGEYDADNEMAPQFMKILELSRRLEGDGFVKAKQIQQLFKSSYRPTPEQVRSNFVELEQMGFGQIRGTGKRMEFSAKWVKVDTSVGTVPTDEIPATQEFRGKMGKVGKVGILEEKTTTPPASSDREKDLKAEKVPTLPTAPTNSQTPYDADVTSVGTSVGTGSTFTHFLEKANEVPGDSPNPDGIEGGSVDTSVGTVPTFRVGDRVANSNPEENSYHWHGVVKTIESNGAVRVWWEERAKHEDKKLARKPELTHKPDQLRKI